MRTNYFVAVIGICLSAAFSAAQGADAPKTKQVAKAEAASGAKGSKDSKDSKTPTASQTSKESQTPKELPKSSEVQSAAADAAQPAEPALLPLVWQDNYTEAMDQAKAENKMMLVHFFRPRDQRRTEAAEAADSVVNVEKTLEKPELREKLNHFVLVKLPLQTEITLKGKTTKLLDHASFAELHKGPGIAVIDLVDPKTEYFGYVVSVLPFTPGKYYRFNSNHLNMLVNLPSGTLTQRSMILAVRIHPEHPASTNGDEDPVLLSEATGHSDYQAEVQVQGHQGWGSRFQRILGKLLGRGGQQGGGYPVEVVAESWPNQDLMDSCVDCVASWRQSEGHWDAVKAQQASYGYDIREGGNGIWYATGIFRPKQ
jgi:hypothetical protein